MKISLGTWAFCFGPYADNPIAFKEIARRGAAEGYDGLEISGFSPHISLDSYPTTESRREVVRMLDDLNLGVSGYSADTALVNPTIEGNKSRYLDLFQRNIELCHDIGSPSIRIDTVAAPGSLDDDEYDIVAARLADIWHNAADLARNAGVRVVWEFEPGFVFNKPSEVDAMLDSVGHANFQVVFDTSHAYMCGVVGARQHGKKEILKGGVSELLGMVADKVGAIHIIDSDGTLYGDETSTHRPFGDGVIDFPALAPKLLALPNIDWWCVDLCFWKGAWDLVGPSLDFVKGLVQVGQSK